MTKTKTNYIGWIVAIFLMTCVQPSQQCGGGGGDNGALAAAQKASRMQELKLWCHTNCVDAWAVWSTCTKPCAGGKQTRTRNEATHSYCSALDSFRCTMSTAEERPCNEACPHGGVPMRGNCHCPRGRAGECCQHAITCDYPGRPAHGRVEGTWPAQVAAVATFSCVEGYQRVGESVLHCGTDGSWSESDIPECQRIACPRPEVQENAILLNEKVAYVYGEQSVFKCSEGYEIEGPESRECREFNATSGRWTGYSPRCTRVSCPDPGIPINGRREGTDLKFGDQVQFSCEPGYRLIGSAMLECLSSKTWFGHIPTCEQLSCEPPYVAEHTRVRVRRTPTGSKATFTCDSGYTLQGPMTILCTAEGFWNEGEPECIAINCGNPGVPYNGYKDGTQFTFQSQISFACQRGYTLVGTGTITCQENGEWTATKPACEACPLNTWANSNGTCIPCPANSHTASLASTSQLQCSCNEGFTGVVGGECLEVRCQTLTTPEHATMTDCDTLPGSTCNFTCNDGYVVEHGTTSLACQPNGVWNGQKPSCLPCQMNTYKSSERACTSCPEYSETDSPAQMREGCTCRLGFSGPAGGPCVDTDECAEDDGTGPCEDACENSVGSYRCRCNRPGYIVDPDDQHLCFPEYQCKNITEDDAPRNGGMVCHWFTDMNSIFCGVRCNPGYEHPIKVNDYETCGPGTGFQWSFRIKANDSDADFPSCVRSFFAGVQLEATTSYFTSNCHDLTEAEKQEVKEVFIGVLNENQVCQVGNRQLCEIKDTGIICGLTTRRKRRDTGVYEDSTQVDLELTVKPIEMIKEHNECNATVCRMLGVRPDECDRVCVSAYNRYIKAAVLYAERKLTQLYSNPSMREALIMDIVNRRFEPKEDDNLVTSGVQQLCEPGMGHDGSVDGSCHPCQPGSYLNEANHTCLLCPMGSYQDEERQTSCKACPLGSTSAIMGGKTCYVCEEGYWGEGCSRECAECVYGACGPFDGLCYCESGYEGEDCSIDVPGCVDAGCFPGVECTDVPAPGTGYTCGECPHGYHGDGVTCIPRAPIPSTQMWMSL